MTSVGRDPGSVIWSVGWDFALGETPEEIDPNTLIVRAIDAVEQAAPQHSRAARSVFGNVMVFMLPLAVRTATRWFLGTAARLNRALAREAATTLLKSTLSIRSTLSATNETLAASQSVPEAGPTAGAIGGDIDVAMRRIATDYMENVVGPLLYFTLAGVPGALAYRTSRHLRDRWGGGRSNDDPLKRAAARGFAIANFVPSFVSGVLLSWTARWTESRGREAWATARQENDTRGWTEPNWPTAALAGALDVRIVDTDTGKDTVNPAGKVLGTDDLKRARRLFVVATGAALAATVILTSLRPRGRR